MKTTLALLVASLATAGLAHAADDGRAIDLNALSPTPEAIEQALAAKSKHDRGQANDRHDRRDRGQTKADEPEPKACTDAAITDDQKTQIEAAAFTAKKEQIQQKADLKIALMDYAQTVMDQTTDKAAAEAASQKITDGATKLVSGHLALANNVFYDILQPTQRKNAFLCLVAKMKKHHKKNRHN
ncbi:hypothetical protein [Bdellovibrio sp. HCB337]|uniref:hypothetical protein n=1 Tax=Bdellovibrio sp. HCB337 TaxID=3394358 RepID=UPI0039A61CE4